MRGVGGDSSQFTGEDSDPSYLEQARIWVNQAIGNIIKFTAEL